MICDRQRLGQPRSDSWRGWLLAGCGDCRVPFGHPYGSNETV